MRAKPTADVMTDSAMVIALLQEQHHDLAELPVVEIGEGWDNKLFRLGSELVVRLPRRAASAALIEHEQRWLPRLVPRLPLPVPVPLRLGRPGAGFPWPWSVVPWYAGHTALRAHLEDPVKAALVLASFLHALHEPAPADAPQNSWRGVPLAARSRALKDHLDDVGGLVNRVAVIELWDHVIVRPSQAAPMWIHGDLHPGNLVVNHGRLSAVIDFGDLCAGDPATDLAVAWMLLPASARSVFRRAYGATAAVDEDLWMRARAWAVALGLAHLAAARDDEAMAAVGKKAIEAALTDNP